MNWAAIDRPAAWAEAYLAFNSGDAAVLSCRGWRTIGFRKINFYRAAHISGYGCVTLAHYRVPVILLIIFGRQARKRRRKRIILSLDIVMKISYAIFERWGSTAMIRCSWANNVFQRCSNALKGDYFIRSINRDDRQEADCDSRQWSCRNGQHRRSCRKDSVTLQDAMKLTFSNISGFIGFKVAHNVMIHLEATRDQLTA